MLVSTVDAKYQSPISVCDKALGEEPKALISGSRSYLYIERTAP
jgi:hypothetical protein